LTKVSKTYDGEKAASSTNVTETVGYLPAETGFKKHSEQHCSEAKDV
jgi:hypothetical protein